MAADIKQDDLPLDNHHGQGDAVTRGYAHRLDTFEFAGRMMELQRGLERIGLQITQDRGHLRAQVRMTGKKFSGVAGEAFGPDQGILRSFVQPQLP